MKGILLFLCLSVLTCSHQDSAYIAEIQQHQNELNEEYLNKDKSPLNEKDRITFQGHDFFPIDKTYAVKAKVERTPDSRPFAMAMSNGRQQLYKCLAILTFELNGKPVALEAYTRVQSFGLAMKTTPVLIPIIDKTTGNTTYEGGRYFIFNSAPEGDEWLIDLNKLTNPYCAYNNEIACPKVPEANHVDLAIEAGIKGS